MQGKEGREGGRKKGGRKRRRASFTCMFFNLHKKLCNDAAALQIKRIGRLKSVHKLLHTEIPRELRM